MSQFVIKNNGLKMVEFKNNAKVDWEEMSNDLRTKSPRVRMFLEESFG